MDGWEFIQPNGGFFITKITAWCALGSIFLCIETWEWNNERWRLALNKSRIFFWDLHSLNIHQQTLFRRRIFHFLVILYMYIHMYTIKWLRFLWKGYDWADGLYHDYPLVSSNAAIAHLPLDGVYGCENPRTEKVAINKSHWVALNPTN